MAEDAENAILAYLSESPSACIEDTYTWSESIKPKIDHKAVVGGVKSLLVDAYLIATELTTSFYTLSKEADEILANGSQEMLVLTALIEKGQMNKNDLEASVGKKVFKVGMGNCMKNKWVKKDGDVLVALKEKSEVSDSVQIALSTLKEKNGAIDALDSKVCMYVLYVLMYDLFMLGCLIW